MALSLVNNHLPEEMASESMDSESELKISSELLRCNICYDRFKQPRTLPCLHSFCEDCLQRHVDSSMTTRNNNNIFLLSHRLHAAVSSEFACPTCREEVTLPAHGVVGFRHDFRIEQMQDFVRKTMKKSTKKPSTTSLTNNDKTCQFCGEKSGSRSPPSFCRDCFKEICQECAIRHRRLPIFSDHRITKIVDSEHAVPKKCGCPQHPEEAIEYLCLTCSQAICAICVMGDQHEEHSVSALRNGLQRYHENLASQHKALQAKVVHIREIQQNLSTSERRVSNLRTKVATDIKHRVDLLVEAIKKEEVKLLLDLNKRCDAELVQIRSVRGKLADALSGMTNIQEFVQSLLHQDMNVDMVPVYQDVMDKIDTGFEESLLLKYDSSFALEFTASARKVKLGRLLHPSEKKSKHDVVLSGMNESEVELDVGLHQIPDLQDLGTESGLFQSPRSRRRAKMAANLHHVVPLPEMQRTRSCDVVDLGLIRPCKQDGVLPPVPRSVHLVAKFGRFGSNGGEFSAPRDLCCLDDGKLMVVADTNNDRLQVFNSDGLLIRVIGQGRLKPWGVTATPAGNIAVTDNLEKCVKVFDKLGNLLLKFGKFLCPCGIAINGQTGEFIVSDFFSTFVFVFSRHGRPLRQFELRGKTDQHMCGASRIAVESRNNVIIISDVSNGHVKMFNRHGKLLHVVSDSTYLISPQGVAVDPQGHVLVADAMKQHVVVMDADGRHLGIILKSKDHDLKDPTGLDLCGKRLGLTQMKMNQVRVYKFD